jgi:hypothetical protein
LLLWEWVEHPLWINDARGGEIARLAVPITEVVDVTGEAGVG